MTKEKLKQIIEEHAEHIPYSEFTHESECRKCEEWFKSEALFFYNLALNKSLNESDMFVEPLPNYGDIIPISEWKDGVRCKVFTSSDGCGNFVKNGKMTSSFEDNVCDLSEIDKMQKKGATHIIWFNK